MHSVHVCDVILAAVALGQAAVQCRVWVGSTKRRRRAEWRVIGGAMWPDKMVKKLTSWWSKSTTPTRCC